MNKLIPTSKGIFAFVEIPFDATEVQIWNHGIGFKSEILKTGKDSNGFQHLCTGLFRWRNWEVITTTTNITEEQAENIVEKKASEGSDIFGIGYHYFVDYVDKNNTLYEEAKESLQSLIQANNLDITKNYVIIKKP